MLVRTDQKYVTKKDRHSVFFYNILGEGRYCIHGVIKIQGQSLLMKWDDTGKADPFYAMSDITKTRSDFDLVVDHVPKTRAYQEWIVSSFPAPLPERINKRFHGKRVKMTLEEV